MMQANTHLSLVSFGVLQQLQQLQLQQHHQKRDNNENKQISCFFYLGTFLVVRSVSEFCTKKRNLKSQFQISQGSVRLWQGKHLIIKQNISEGMNEGNSIPNPSPSH